MSRLFLFALMCLTQLCLLSDFRSTSLALHLCSLTRHKSKHFSSLSPFGDIIFSTSGNGLLSIVCYATMERNSAMSASSIPFHFQTPPAGLNSAQLGFPCGTPEVDRYIDNQIYYECERPPDCPVPFLIALSRDSSWHHCSVIDIVQDDLASRVARFQQAYFQKVDTIVISWLLSTPPCKIARLSGLLSLLVCGASLECAHCIR
ncbi:uncharacterized protein LAESUDRAFT_151140 [Laetiporus sulphureus 93-53]|uniref:Uncharacterized protein n=1 Tax=Laetiporus sulphureus 93-53 TaxID=1314785 RepID=A0A165HI10_9APHY|nr:uncharacterized protein LAESUDRAFT_151140 [Laetiporus sulphureus 93-53]KZT11757.1 hypothetical protein LAESUDRAFT_151140 [Laetiporus sulphureus 93-53]